MINLRITDDINEYDSLVEKKKNLEDRLYALNFFTYGREATYDELKEEISYRKKITLCENEIQQKKQEIKKSISVKCGIYTLSFVTLVTLLCAFTRCSKEENSSIQKSSNISINEIEDETEKVLIKSFIK